MRISEIMSTPVYTVRPEAQANAAWEMMRLHDIRHLLVTNDEGHVLGIIAASDLGGKHGETLRASRRVRELMTEKLVVASQETTVREAANLMRGHKTNCLPVFKGRRLKGIVTALDLLELLGRGAERPVTRVTRRVLKDRGVTPRQAIIKNAPKRAAF